MHRTSVSRLPLTIRVVLLLPLLATGVDLARATLACGPDAQTCLEAAGRGWLGGAAVVLVVFYALAGAAVLARAARGLATGGRTPGFLPLWALGSAGMGAVTAGQMALAHG